MHRIFRILVGATVGLGALTAQAFAGVAALPDVTVQEAFTGPGQAEYTVTIDSSAVGNNWFISLFAVGASVGNNTDITNNIGQWTSTIVSEADWDNGFIFEVGTPGGPVTLFDTADLVNFGTSFADVFGGDSHANVYWAGSYLDFSTPTFSLIGPNETRG